MESEPSPNAILNFGKLNNAFPEKSYQHDRLSVQKNCLIILEKIRTFTVTVPKQKAYDKMTDFKLDDGTYLDVGQQYILQQLMYASRIKIRRLDSRKERILFLLYGFRNGFEGAIVTRELTWQEFKLGYERGLITKWDAINISKRLPPHTFL